MLNGMLLSNVMKKIFLKSWIRLFLFYVYNCTCKHMYIIFTNPCILYQVSMVGQSWAIWITCLSWRKCLVPQLLLPWAMGPILTFVSTRLCAMGQKDRKRNTCLRLAFRYFVHYIQLIITPFQTSKFVL